jgi:hypothetical protein
MVFVSRHASTLALVSIWPWTALAQSSAPIKNPLASAAKHDISRPLLQMASSAILVEEAAGPRPIHVVRTIPRPPKKLRPEEAAPSGGGVQTEATTVLDLDLLSPLDGVGFKNYLPDLVPADTNGAVGSSQFVQWVNTALIIYDKASEKIALGPVDGKVVWRGFGGPCERENDGDPIVQYDRDRDRWILSQFAVNSGPPFYECIAVSVSSDALGKYARYSYRFNDFNDYPKFGVGPDGYYITFNMFRGTSMVGAKACVMQRDEALAGKAAALQCFDFSYAGGLLAADIDGKTTPPAGSPGYLMNLDNDGLNLWKVTVDWKKPARFAVSPSVFLPVEPFEVACGDQIACIPQRGSSQKLSPLSDRLMYRLAYRNFGDHESLVVNHAVQINDAVGIRWYEIRDPRADTPTVYQQSTYLPQGRNFRWMGSVAQDHVGNLALGYSTASTDDFPSIRIAGRSVNDPLHRLSIERTLRSSDGAQAVGQYGDRWGDYSSMSVDPVDDCTFWYTTQYIGLNADGNPTWGTHIGRFRFRSCR